MWLSEPDTVVRPSWNRLVNLIRRSVEPQRPYRDSVDATTGREFWHLCDGPAVAHVRVERRLHSANPDLSHRATGYDFKNPNARSASCTTSAADGPAVESRGVQREERHPPAGTTRC